MIKIINIHIFSILVFSLLPISIFAQAEIDLVEKVNEIEITKFQKIIKFCNLPKVIKKKFRKYNRKHKKPLFGKIYDGNKYEFIFAAYFENLYIINYSHKGRGNHYHISIISTEDSSLSHITFDAIKASKSIEEMIKYVEVIKEKKSHCNLE